jgi:hypothetical protein
VLDGLSLLKPEDFLVVVDLKVVEVLAVGKPAVLPVQIVVVVPQELEKFQELTRSW